MGDDSLKYNGYFSPAASRIKESNDVGMRVAGDGLPDCCIGTAQINKRAIQALADAESPSGKLLALARRKAYRDYREQKNL